MLDGLDRSELRDNLGRGRCCALCCGDVPFVVVGEQIDGDERGCSLRCACSEDRRRDDVGGEVRFDGLVLGGGELRDVGARLGDPRRHYGRVAQRLTECEIAPCSRRGGILGLESGAGPFEHLGIVSRQSEEAVLQ